MFTKKNEGQPAAEQGVRDVLAELQRQVDAHPKVTRARERLTHAQTAKTEAQRLLDQAGQDFALRRNRNAQVEDILDGKRMADTTGVSERYAAAERAHELATRAETQATDELHNAQRQAAAVAGQDPRIRKAASDLGRRLALAYLDLAKLGIERTALQDMVEAAGLSSAQIMSEVFNPSPFLGGDARQRESHFATVAADLLRAGHLKATDLPAWEWVDGTVNAVSRGPKPAA
jgi:hypothetical protein